MNPQNLKIRIWPLWVILMGILLFFVKENLPVSFNGLSGAKTEGQQHEKEDFTCSLKENPVLPHTLEPQH